MGYEGWRFDFVKGYGPQFVKEYVADTVGADTFNVGEYWVDLRCGLPPPFFLHSRLLPSCGQIPPAVRPNCGEGIERASLLCPSRVVRGDDKTCKGDECVHRWNGSELDYNQDDARQTIVNWIDGTGGLSSAFDFPLKGILQVRAHSPAAQVSEGDPYSYCPPASSLYALVLEWVADTPGMSVEAMPDACLRTGADLVVSRQDRMNATCLCGVDGARMLTRACMRLPCKGL